MPQPISSWYLKLDKLLHILLHEFYLAFENCWCLHSLIWFHTWFIFFCEIWLLSDRFIAIAIRLAKLSLSLANSNHEFSCYRFIFCFHFNFAFIFSAAIVLNYKFILLYIQMIIIINCVRKINFNIVDNKSSINMELHTIKSIFSKHFFGTLLMIRLIFIFNILARYFNMTMLTNWNWILNSFLKYFCTLSMIKWFSLWVLSICRTLKYLLFTLLAYSN